LAVTVDGLPSGVTVAPATIGVDATSATLRFRAAATAAIGVEAALTVKAASGQASLERTATSRLTVAGRPGTLDTTFGDGGILVDGLSPTVADRAESAFPQSEGRVVTVGNTFVSGSRLGITMRRYRRDGTVDTSFGNNGTLTETFTDLGAVSPAVGHAVPQSSGAIIVVGTADVDPASNAERRQKFIRRYTADGRVDPTFVGRQVVLPSSLAAVSRMVVGPNDEILMGGTIHISDSKTAGYIARLSAEGDVDTAFGTAGVRTIDSTVDTMFINGIVPQAEGAMIVGVGGANSGSFGAVYWLVRLDRNGTPDATFAGDGRLDVAVEVRSLHPGHDGVFVIGGTPTGAIGDPYVLKFDARGRPDARYGTGGTWHDTAQTNHQMEAIELGRAGEQIGAGLRYQNFTTPVGLVIWGLTAAGNGDPSFGTAGAVVTTMPIRPAAVLVHDDESRSTVVGSTVDGSSQPIDQVLVRIWK
jgi:uncharacterized delta-60 repeat protein